MSEAKHVIVFCSPAGSTKKVAKKIELSLYEQGVTTSVLELFGVDWEKEVKEILLENSHLQCLWIGSPVYAQHIVPPVSEFLSWLPQAKNNVLAVPFVTWGAVSSGVALYETGAQLIEKGYLLAGAVKVLAEHSSMWKSEHPFGEGRPNEQDLEKIDEIVNIILKKIQAKDFSNLNLDILDYQPDWIKDFANKISIQKLKEVHPGYVLNQEKCNQCGVCAENCPAGAITLNPYPDLGENCFLCNNCARFCPEEAMTIDLSSIEERIQELAAKTNERKETEIFY